MVMLYLHSKHEGHILIKSFSLGKPIAKPGGEIALVNHPLLSNPGPGCTDVTASKGSLSCAKSQQRINL